MVFGRQSAQGTLNPQALFRKFAGTPTGTPNTNGGAIQIYDTSNDLLYQWSVGGAAWVCITPVTVSVETSQTTTSNPFTDLATVGPSVSMQTGTKAVAWVHSEIFNNTGGQYSTISVAVSGATTIAASTGVNLGPLNTGTIPIDVAGMMMFAGTLTAGVNVFTCKYSVNSGTGTFGRRRLTVVGVP
jgi:hypothetical protein